MDSLPPAGSQGAMFALLLFQLMNPGWCQLSGLAGLCSDCEGTRKSLHPNNMKYFSDDRTQVIPCHSIIRFKLDNRIVCGQSGEEWVDQLKGCIETKEFEKCGRKAKKTTPTPAQVTTMSAATAPVPTFVLTTTTGSKRTTHAPAPAFVLTTTTGSGWTTHSTSTPRNPQFTEKDQYQTTLETKNDATNWTNNDALAAAGGLKDELKNATPAPQTDKMKHLTVAVLSLLAVVFVLVSLVSYLICKKKANRKKYEEVQTSDSGSLQ